MPRCLPTSAPRMDPRWIRGERGLAIDFFLANRRGSWNSPCVHNPRVALTSCENPVATKQPAFYLSLLLCSPLFLSLSLSSLYATVAVREIFSSRRNLGLRFASRMQARVYPRAANFRVNTCSRGRARSLRADG